MSRGGKRKGAGRPSKGYDTTLSVRVPADVAETIRQMAKEQGKAQGDIIVELVRARR